MLFILCTVFFTILAIIVLVLIAYAAFVKPHQSDIPFNWFHLLPWIYLASEMNISTADLTTSADIWHNLLAVIGYVSHQVLMNRYIDIIDTDYSRFSKIKMHLDIE